MPSVARCAAPLRGASTGHDSMVTAKVCSEPKLTTVCHVDFARAAGSTSTRPGYNRRSGYGCSAHPGIFKGPFLIMGSNHSICAERMRTLTISILDAAFASRKGLQANIRIRLAHRRRGRSRGDTRRRWSDPPCTSLPARTSAAPRRGPPAHPTPCRRSRQDSSRPPDDRSLRHA